MIEVTCPHCGHVFGVVCKWSEGKDLNVKAIIVECPKCHRDSAAVQKL